MTEPEFLKQWHANFPKYPTENKVTNCPYPTARTCPIDPKTGKFQSEVAEFAYVREASKLGITREQFQLVLQAHNFAEDKSKMEFKKWQEQRAATGSSVNANHALEETIVSERTFKTEEHVELIRKENGDVQMEISDAWGNQHLYYDIPSNIWASLVLTMSKFNERPGDWHEFMAHHQGTRDVLTGSQSHDSAAVQSHLELRKRLSEKAIALKEDGDWQTCDLLREARNVIEKSVPADAQTKPQ